MNGSEEKFSSSFSPEEIEQAARWVARHERGLFGEEKRAFEQWLSENPNHEACFFEHQVAWAGFDVMDDWKPAYSSPPNPDLFEDKPKGKWSGFIPYGGLAAAILLGFFLLQTSLREGNESSLIVPTTYKAQNNEKHFLEDGTSFYLLADSEVRVAYSETGRTIEFLKGEVHFSVAHDPNRPFVVESKVGRVTALGTVFSVKQDSETWEVLVTEGKVKVDETATDRKEHGLYTAELVAGQIIVQDFSEEYFLPRIEVISDNDLREKLAWKDQIIDMVSAPLEEILFEFSQFNDRKVIVLDEELKKLRMTVAIKPDNLEDFLDLLELTVGVRVTDTSTGTILLSSSFN